MHHVLILDAQNRPGMDGWGVVHWPAAVPQLGVLALAEPQRLAPPDLNDIPILHHTLTTDTQNMPGASV